MADKLKLEAAAAYVDDDFATSIELYTKAIALTPNDAELYAARAQAQIKEENFLEGVQDASKAVELAPQLAKAHLRKGIALFNLDEYESAKEAFEAAHSLDKRRETEIWIRKCNAELEGEMQTEEEHNGKAPATNGVSAPAAPTVGAAAPPTTPIPAAPAVPAQQQPNGAQEEEKKVQEEDPTKAIAKAAPDAPSHGKYRWQFFQTPTMVEVGILAKRLTPDRVSIEIQERRLHARVTSPEGEPEFELDVELYDEVVPAESKYEILGTKVEVRLKKRGAVSWPTLEKSEQVAAANFSNPAVEQAPVYPSSHPRGKKMDWNKLEAEVKKDEKEEKLEGEQALQKLFRDIYGNADEDTRRAMNKSFQESGGTVLSTNWKEVGSKKVTCSPPTGMENKTYEQ